MINPIVYIHIFKNAFEKIYGKEDYIIKRQFKRYINLIEEFKNKFQFLE